MSDSSQKSSDRLDPFKRYTVAHPILMHTDERLRRAIEEPASRSLIFVYGPTGVGKTTMRQHVETKLLENDGSDGPGQLPLASLETPAPESGSFQWKDFYTRALKALEEPFIDDKVDYETSGISANEDKKLVVKRHVTKAALRRSLESALQHRSPKALILDEAQHLTHMTSGRRLRDQLECLKSLANITETTLVLIGTYDLLAFRNLSGQLSRRSIDIHFARYDASREKERHAFQRVLKSFQEHLPLEEPPDLVEDWSFFYERSLGCVGILKDWLTMALADGFHRNEVNIDLDWIRDRALSVNQCETILRSIQEGEDSLEDDPKSRDRLMHELGLTDQNGSAPESGEEESGGSSSSNGPVGVRNPQRDPVGVEG